MAQVDSYKFGRKNQWRRAVWKDLASRISDKKNAVVLYLAAKEDLDRRVAINNGFRSNNLIAVDTSQAVVDGLRKQGKLAIKGKLSEVVAEWPRSKRLDVVFADYCAGMTTEVYDLMYQLILLEAISSGGAVMVNMQRGRENGAARDANNEYFKAATGEEVLHRGMWLYSLVAFLMCHWKWGTTEGQTYSEIAAHLRIVEKLLNHYCYTYKSTVQMDSVVVSLPEICSDRIIENHKPERRMIKLKNRISAILAVRTMRNNGQLPNSPSY